MHCLCKHKFSVFSKKKRSFYDGYLCLALLKKGYGNRVYDEVIADMIFSHQASSASRLLGVLCKVYETHTCTLFITHFP